MLSDFQDAYGHQLYDCFRGKKVVEVLERDDCFIHTSAMYPRYYLAEYKDWLPHEKKAIRYVTGRVLDVGCGGGRVSLYLQKRGFDVFGIDTSPLAVRVCKLRRLRKARVMSITEVSSKLGTFDTILMIGNNFGLFGNPTKARRLLRQFYQITSTNARIIAESVDPYQTKEQFHLDYHKRNLRKGKMPGELKLRVRYKKYQSPWFDYLIVSENEMKKILEETGWRVKRFIRNPRSPVYIGICGKISR